MADDTEPPSSVGAGGLREALDDAIQPLKAAAPDADVDIDDLAVIAEAIGHADVIGIGEASHGTREFFRFNHWLVRYLVEEHGLRLLGVEANFAAALDINDYVMSGDGTAEAVLCQDCIHDPFQTESVLELVDWIRKFNEGRRPADRVRFHGFDVQFPPVAAAKLGTYFEAVDRDILEDVRGPMDQLVENWFPDLADDEAIRNHLAARNAVVETLRTALQANQRSYVDTTSRKRYERARRLVWLLEAGRRQYAAIYEGQTGVDSSIVIRDRAMAAQVQWLLDHEPVDRMAIWAHNAHLSRREFGGGTVRFQEGLPSLGQVLAAHPDVDYYALGLLLGGGQVRSTAGPSGTFRVPGPVGPPAGSVPAVFRRLDAPLFFLDVTGLPPESTLAEWFDTGPPRYVIIQGPGDTPVRFVDSDLRRQFDGIVFIRETTAARPIDPG